LVPFILFLLALYFLHYSFDDINTDYTANYRRDKKSPEANKIHSGQASPTHGSKAGDVDPLHIRVIGEPLK